MYFLLGFNPFGWFDDLTDAGSQWFFDLLCVLRQPIAFLSLVMNGFTDLVAGILPSTPDDWKLLYLIDQAVSHVPFFGWGIIYQIIEGLFVILLILFFWKIVKLLPFIG